MYYREVLELDDNWGKWDVFISAYNASDRVSEVFRKVSAEEKFWAIFPEYNFVDHELPNCGVIANIEGVNEVEQINSLVDKARLIERKGEKICIDVTGFLRAQLVFLIAYLKRRGFRSVDIIYSEPSFYSKKENTIFSSGSVSETRQVLGFQGANKLSSKKDLMIIAAGYDVSLISKSAQYNENAEIVPLLGFPSLRADMFQENMLRTALADESFSMDSLKAPIFAPAFDPFETAKVLTDYMLKNRCIENYGHVYLCPLSTKPQVIGMALTCLNEFHEQSVSILYPFSNGYSKETSVGLSRVWKYTIEFEE